MEGVRREKASIETNKVRFEISEEMKCSLDSLEEVKLRLEVVRRNVSEGMRERKNRRMRRIKMVNASLESSLEYERRL